MQQLHGSKRDSERKPATIEDCERHVASPLDRKDSERKPLTIIGDSEGHAANFYGRHCETCRISIGQERQRESDSDHGIQWETGSNSMELRETRRDE